MEAVLYLVWTIDREAGKWGPISLCIDECKEEWCGVSHPTHDWAKLESSMYEKKYPFANTHSWREWKKSWEGSSFTVFSIILVEGRRIQGQFPPSLVKQKNWPGSQRVRKIISEACRKLRWFCGGYHLIYLLYRWGYDVKKETKASRRETTDQYNMACKLSHTGVIENFHLQP